MRGGICSDPQRKRQSSFRPSNSGKVQPVVSARMRYGVEGSSVSVWRPAVKSIIVSLQGVANTGTYLR